MFGSRIRTLAVIFVSDLFFIFYIMTLHASLPSCQQLRLSPFGLNPFTAMTLLEKRPLTVRNSKPISLSVFFYALECKRIFIKMHNIKIRYDTEAENTLFAGMSVHFQPGNFTSWGSERVNNNNGHL